MKKTILFSLMASLGLTMANAQVPSYQWAKSFGGNGNEFVNGLCLDPSGNIYVIGTFEATMDLDPGAATLTATSNGASDIFLSKYNEKGELRWAKNMGSTANDGGFSVCTDKSGNVYATGSFQGTTYFDGSSSLSSYGSDDVFVVKYDSTGNIVWLKSMGYIQSDYGRSIAVDTAGGLYLTGKFRGAVTFDPGSSSAYLTSVGGTEDAFVLKLDTDGNYQWARGIGGVNYDVGTAVAVDWAGNVYVAGMFSGMVNFDAPSGSYNLTSHGLIDAYIAKYDKSGSFSWAHSFGGAFNDYPRGITVDNKSNVYVVGYFNERADFDASVISPTLTSYGSADAFVCKFNSVGALQWNKQLGGVDGDYAYGVSVDESGAVYVSGSFSATADMDPSAGVMNLTAKGGLDIFITKFDDMGNALWAKGMGGNADDESTAVCVSADGNKLYTAGNFRNEVDFDPGTPVVSLMANGSSDAYIHKLAIPSTGIQHSFADVALKLFPNPASNYLYINLFPFMEGTRVELYDRNGAKILGTELRSSETTLDLSGLATGTYYLGLYDAQQTLLKSTAIFKQ